MPIVSHHYNGKTIICEGGADVSWNNQRRLFQLSVYENKAGPILFRLAVKDAMRAISRSVITAIIYLSHHGVEVYLNIKMIFLI